MWHPENKKVIDDLRITHSISGEAKTRFCRIAEGLDVSYARLASSLLTHVLMHDLGVLEQLKKFSPIKARESSVDDLSLDALYFTGGEAGDD